MGTCSRVGTNGHRCCLVSWLDLVRALHVARVSNVRHVPLPESRDALGVAIAPRHQLAFVITLAIGMAQIAFMNFIALYFSLVEEGARAVLGSHCYFTFPDRLGY
jgi:hypothetical protein